LALQTAAMLQTAAETVSSGDAANNG